MKSPMNLDYKEIGDRIQACRKNKRITQGEFAKYLGISSSQVSHIECGISRPSLDVVAKICEKLEVSADEIIFGKQSDTTNPGNYKDTLDTLLIDCPDLDQKIIVDVTKAVKESIHAARLSAYKK